MSNAEGRGRFESTVALVTGGASGIGEATSRLLHREGARVVIADIDVARADALAESLPGSVAMCVDVASSADVERTFASVCDQLGHVDVVVNSAGVDDPVVKSLMGEQATAGQRLDTLRSLSDEQWRRVLSINLDGAFHVLRAAARVMIPRESGAVVLVGSSAGFDAIAGYEHYVASKAGVHALTKSAGKELARFGIRVNAVAPGPVDTPMAGRSPASIRAALGSAVAVPFATAEEIADNIAFLASPEAANVVGEVLLSNRGRFTA